MMKQLHWKEPELNVILLCGDVIVTSTVVYQGDEDENNTHDNAVSSDSVF